MQLPFSTFARLQANNQPYHIPSTITIDIERIACITIITCAELCHHHLWLLPKLHASLSVLQTYFITHAIIVDVLVPPLNKKLKNPKKMAEVVECQQY